MSGALLLVLLVAPLVGALALGVWIGLGYPGLEDRRERPARTRRRRRTPFEMIVDRIVGFFDG